MTSITEFAGRVIDNVETVIVGKREQIELLSKSGFQPKEIAELIGTTPNTVRVGLAALRKSSSKRRT